MDLVNHGVEKARNLLCGRLARLSHAELMEFPQKEYFDAIEISVVHREAEARHFEALMAVAVRQR